MSPSLAVCGERNFAVSAADLATKPPYLSARLYRWLECVQLYLNIWIHQVIKLSKFTMIGSSFCGAVLSVDKISSQ